jgi:hypothetical protein
VPNKPEASYIELEFYTAIEAGLPRLVCAGHTWVERAEAVGVEVVDTSWTWSALVSAALGDRGYVHTLHRQQHHLRPLPVGFRTRSLAVTWASTRLARIR